MAPHSHLLLGALALAAHRSTVSAFAITARLPVAHAAVASTPSRSVRPITCAAEGLSDKIKEAIASDKVVVFSKSWCPFCMKTKDLFDGLGTKYTAVELDEMDDGADWQDELLAQTGQRTVPNVFINGQHLGGNDDTQKAAATGKLQELLGL